ncbi:TRAP transporter fused permease subunit [Rhodoplanes serenus]|uniref:TRAP transporter fused permease subunit n=1 Tax=Rhodoplanes serenus TaxID=200615 RepID=A0A9X5AR12_9BRAD|nr:TRAP transporter fused permease subunit [Rhodoplanes serenus]MTW14598.1 TRAP transporter fused permease subunit [Rhodoplanes serenus]
MADERTGAHSAPPSGSGRQPSSDGTAAATPGAPASSPGSPLPGSSLYGAAEKNDPFRPLEPPPGYVPGSSGRPAPVDSALPDVRLTSQGAISDEALRKAEAYIEQEEGAANRLSGRAGMIVTAIAVVSTLFHLYAAYAIVPTQTLRYVHVAFVMALCFLLFPLATRFRNAIRWWDVVAAIASVGILGYALIGGEEFTDRATMPDPLDVVLGVVFIVLLLEATRRTTGWIMPVVAILFIVYALVGPYLPAPWTHRGYTFTRLVGHLFITLEGIFGVAVDVSSSLIIMFTIYGAFLQHSGAGKFFINFSLAVMGGKPNSAGRTVVLSSFLLGGPSGSGVATTVTIGAVAYPMMARAGFEKNAAGGLLAAGGLGAILSPPVLGAAAFLIAEFLKISYLDVIWMALIPTCLYYLSLLFMVELDARRFGAKAVPYDTSLTIPQMLRRYGFHFTSLVAVVGFMVAGYSPMLSVFWSTLLVLGLSFLRPDTALWPKKLVRALADGTIGVLNAATTCASAGIIVGVVTLTGLGLKFSSIVLAYAGNSLLLTALYTALIVWIVGLAVPVTASYIICAVIAAPALIKLGVPEFAAHMFIFYYAVLSEVSPPTALSPFAAAAITGGDPYRTTLQAWKYTLPAFLVPFVFILDPLGVGLLMAVPKGGTVLDVVLIALKTAIGLGALAVAAQGWAWRAVAAGERGLWIVAGLLLVFPSLLEPATEWLVGVDVPHPAWFGLALVALLVLHQIRTRGEARPA